MRIHLPGEKKPYLEIVDLFPEGIDPIPELFKEKIAALFFENVDRLFEVGLFGGE
jgi:hypothetical protein